MKQIARGIAWNTVYLNLNNLKRAKTSTSGIVSDLQKL